MNVKNWIPLVAAVLLGLIALVVARKALSKGGNDTSKSAMTTVVVINRDVPAGHQLKPEDVQERRVPNEAAMNGSFRTARELDGRTTVFPLKKGDTVLDTLLAPVGTAGGLNALIPEGYRAMTLEVNQFTGVAGMIQPGSRVDIISVLRDEKGGQAAARTILQNIEVRAVGRNVNPATNDPNAPQPPPSDNVTLLLTPDDAQVLQLASQSGRPWLVMRNNKDRRAVETAITTLASIRGDAGNGQAGPTMPDSTVPVADQRPSPSDPADPFGPRSGMSAARVVQVIRGGVESTVTFQDNNQRHAPKAPATRPTAPKLSDAPRVITGTGAESKPE